MYGQMVKNLMFGQDVLTYQKLKGLFGSFGKALDTASLAELRRYTPEGQGPNTISVMVLDGIPVDIAFSMVTKKGNRDARYGRLVFARKDGDEALIFWVTYFDQKGKAALNDGVPQVDIGKPEHMVILCQRLWELLDIRFDEVENFNEIVTERGSIYETIQE